MSKKNTVIITVAAGFYYFGTEVTAPEGYIALKDAAMFGKFGGGRGLAGVATGQPEATVTLDRFKPDDTLLFPIHAVYCIHPSIDLYEFNGTTLR